MQAFTKNNFNALFGPLEYRNSIVYFRKRQIIFSQGDPNDRIFRIEEGTVKATVNSRHGKEAIIGLFRRGDFFGESCISPHLRVRSYNAVALIETKVLQLSRTSVLQKLRASTSASSAFIEYVIKRNQLLQDDLASALLDTSQQRLNRALSSFSQALEKNKANRLARVSQQTLAEAIGASRQRVNFLLRNRRGAGSLRIAV